MALPKPTKVTRGTALDLITPVHRISPMLDLSRRAIGQSDLSPRLQEQAVIRILATLSPLNRGPIRLVETGFICTAILETRPIPPTVAQSFHQMFGNIRCH